METNGRSKLESLQIILSLVCDLKPSRYNPGPGDRLFESSPNHICVIPALVSAHGYVQQVTIDGTIYIGNNLHVETPFPSIIRLVSTNDPVKCATNQDLFCESQAQLDPWLEMRTSSQLEILWVDGPNISLN